MSFFFPPSPNSSTHSHTTCVSCELSSHKHVYNIYTCMRLWRCVRGCPASLRATYMRVRIPLFNILSCHCCCCCCCSSLDFAPVPSSSLFCCPKNVSVLNPFETKVQAHDQPTYKQKGVQSIYTQTHKHTQNNSPRNNTLVLRSAICHERAAPEVGAVAKGGLYPPTHFSNQTAPANDNRWRTA